MHCSVQKLDILLFLKTTNDTKPVFLRATALIYAIARVCYHPSVRPSVTRVDQSNTVEARIMKFSPYGSLIHPVLCGISFIQKF